MDNEITAAESFSISVEQLATDEDSTLLSALAKKAEYYGLTDKINQYVTRPLKEKLEKEAIKNGLFKNEYNEEINLIDECF